jgi:hypothetical protein
MNYKNTKIPNLFIVGAPKCGTTSLHYWLSQHPEIFMSEPKEPWFFCSDLHKEADDFAGYKVKYFKYRAKDDYLQLFKNAKQEKIIGESSPRYLYSKEAPKNILKFNSDAKIIIMIRDPIHFIHSWHSQLVNSGFEPIIKFENAINKEKKRKKGSIPSQTLIPAELLYSKMANFSKQIKNYLSSFSKKQIKIILLDDLKERPKNTFKEVLKFLEVKDINFTPELEVKNCNRKIKSIFMMKFLKSSNYQTIKKPIQKILPKPLRSKIYFKLRDNNIKIKPRKSMDKNLEKQLKKQFKSEVKKLSKITDRDLIALWGYDKI